MKASVIIPTRNRARTLDACLRSLVTQSIGVDAFEVVVVDNGSTDDTLETAARYKSMIDLKVVEAPEPGLHVARHAGMRAAGSEILVFGDDDIVAGPGWVASVVDAFSEGEVALVGGNNLPLFERAPPDWLTRLWERRFGAGRALATLSILDFGEGRFDVDPHYVWGCNFSVRRDVLLSAVGFHPDAMPADRIHLRGDGESHVSEWIRLAGMRAVFDSGASVHHTVPASRMTSDYFSQRAYAQGISDSYTDIRTHGTSRCPVSVRIRRRARNLARHVAAAARHPTTSAGRESGRVVRRSLLGWQSGYDFHQRAVDEDPELLAWVTKENYL